LKNLQKWIRTLTSQAKWKNISKRNFQVEVLTKKAKFDLELELIKKENPL